MTVVGHDGFDCKDNDNGLNPKIKVTVPETIGHKSSKNMKGRMKYTCDASVMLRKAVQVWPKQDVPAHQGIVFSSGLGFIPVHFTSGNATSSRLEAHHTSKDPLYQPFTPKIIAT